MTDSRRNGWRFPVLIAGAMLGAVLSNLPATPVAAAAPNYQDNPAIIDKLRRLQPGSAVSLGKARVTGKHIKAWAKRFRNGPYVRDFCRKMPYMPDRGTAFYAGANHGSPHRFNDAWEYHLGSNTWHLLFPPDGGDHRVFRKYRMNVKKKREVEKNTEALKAWFDKNVVFRDGTLQTRKGGPLAPWHTWDGITYDRHSKRAMWAVLSTKKGLLGLYAEMTGRDLGAMQKAYSPGSGLWMFDFEKGHWIRQTGTQVNPKMIGMGGTLEYIPELGASFWFAASWRDDEGGWLYDDVKNTWRRLQINGRRKFYGKNSLKPGKDLAPPQEMQSAYSSRHRKLVAVRDGGAWVYDIDRNTWKLVARDRRIRAHDARTVFVYDSKNDVFLLADYRDRSLYAFSLLSTAWTRIKPNGAPVPKARAAGFYDEQHDVFVLAGEKGKVWVYRHGG